MIHFEWPWLFIVLPLPLVVRLVLPPLPAQRDAALRVPFIDDFRHASSASHQFKAKRWPLLIALIAWISLVTASARPQWLGEPIELPVNGRDLLLAVDLSGSMEVEDFQLNNQVVNRLTATQQIAGEFIERRVGDRVGLILFGKQAYLQTPLTFDRTTVQTLLNEAVIGLAGQETAIGDAIGLAVKRLRNKAAGNRVVILLTDGANTAGEVEPLKAAELAASEGLKIYTIGIGADEMLVRSLFGTRRIDPSTDLDEKTLKAIAEKTGGRYFRARNTRELEEIYHLLDELEPIEQEKQTFRPTRSLFPWPLALACMLASFVVINRAVKGSRS
ncbi:MAG: VWA domain-containing protein [Gammaproteobacteria bacterium]